MRFQKGKDDPVSLAFNFPSGSATPVPELAKASVGMPLQAAEIEGAQRRAWNERYCWRPAGRRELPTTPLRLWSCSRAETRRSRGPRSWPAWRDSLYQQAQLYDRKRQDDPEKLKVFSNLALGALKDVPESKQTKELSEKIQKGMKK